MYEEIIQIIGDKKGPASIILAGVHGDEKCTVEAMDKILPNLKIHKGTVLFGYGNPRAIEANVRQTEANLNRLFKNDNLLTPSQKQSYEYARAQFLKPYLDKAEVLLDLHASSIPHTKPFIICEPNAKGIVEYLPADIIVSRFDKVEPGGTDYYMNRSGKIGICLECGCFKEPISTQIAQESIWAFLKAMEHIPNDISPRKQSYIQMYKEYLTKTDKFTLAKHFENFEIVGKNQLIGTDGQEKIKAPRKSLILFAQNCKKVGDEAFLLGEKI